MYVRKFTLELESQGNCVQTALNTKLKTERGYLIKKDSKRKGNG